MSKTDALAKLNWIASLIAISVALAIPLRASGVAAEQAALGVALLGSMFLFVREPAIRKFARQAIISPQARVISLIFIAWVITIFFSHNLFASFKMGTRTGVFLLASMMIWATLSHQQDAQELLKKTLIVASLSFALIALMSLNGVPYIVTILKLKYAESAAPTTNIFKAFGVSTMCLIPVVIWAGRQLKGRWKYLAYSFPFLALTIIIMTSSRSALAGILAMILAVILLMSIAHRRYVKSLVIGAVFTLIGAVTWLRFKELGVLHVEGTYLPDWLIDPHRQNIWKFAYDRFLDHPWVGNGIDQINRLPGAKMPVPGLGDYAAFVPSHPHNWSMEILSETGLVGFLPLVFALGFIVWRLTKDYIRTKDEAALAKIALMTGFWSSALFNFSIWAAWWQLTLFILFAILSSSRKPVP
ncbi:MAG: hypothetical protein COB46_01080 [Rhodospirillaceae bacterium]|nr:MAG: hypothetical protein COB46_01080 [Rhodospirillaceae bacterium]